MKLLRALAPAAVPLYADLVLLSCLFTFFVYTGGEGDTRFSIPLYLVAGLCALVTNRLLALRERTVYQAALINAVVAAPLFVLLWRSVEDIQGLGPYVALPLTFLYPFFRAFLLNRTSPTADIMLTYSEMAVLGTACFFLMQVGDFDAGVLNLHCVLALILNICALSAMRLSGARERARNRAGIQRWLVLTLAAALLAVATFLVGLVFLPSFTQLVVSLLAALWQGVVWLFATLWRLVEWFFSLFASELEAVGELPPPVIFDAGEMAMEEVSLPGWVLLAILSVAGAAVAGLLVYLLAKVGRLRLRWGLSGDSSLEERRTTPSLLELLRRWLKRIVRRLGCWNRLLWRWNTAAGMFVRLEYRGKRCGRGRNSWETPREFLEALALHTGCGEEAEAAFTALADQMDFRCFAPEGRADNQPLPPRQRKLLLQATRPNRKALGMGRKEAVGDISGKEPDAAAKT